MVFYNLHCYHLTTMSKAILLLNITCIVLSQAKNQTMWISRTSCTLQYQQISSVVIFQRCMGQGFQNSNWKDCFIACCKAGDIPEQYETPSDGALTACYTGVFPDAGLSSEQLAFIVTGSIILGIFCISFLCKVCSKLKIKKVQSYRENEHGNDWQRQTKLNKNQNLIQWSERARSNRPLKAIDHPCCICLQLDTTAQLVCRHQYHPKCIGTWLSKNDLCPCCRRENIKGVKIYCQSCRWRYFICGNRLLMERGEELPKKCEVCEKESEEVVDSLVEILPQQSNEYIVATQHIQESIE